MEIKVLGTGCSTCKALYATVETVNRDNGIDATLMTEEDLMKIMNYNVMTLPALVIDDIVVAKGKLSEGEVKKLIESNK
ncbi:MAG: thioredoxin family protein [Bacteroidales bacterium]